MKLRGIIFTFLGVWAVFAQDLPDRDAQTDKFLNPATTSEGMRDLMVSFQLGGIRTVIRNLNGLPAEQREQVAFALMHLDLFRFRNDLNANVIEAQDSHARAVNLLLLGTLGDQLADSVFQPYADDASQDIRVRLAAAGGMVNRQNIQAYQSFYEIAKDAEYNPVTGKDDFRFAGLSYKNAGFSAYSRGRLDESERGLVDDKYIVTAILTAGPSDVSIPNYLATRRAKNYIPLVIDQAIRVGGMDLLDALAEHKWTKKRYQDEIVKAKAVISVLAGYNGKFMDQHPKDQYPIGALIPRFSSGRGEGDYRPAYGIVKVDNEGNVSLVENQQPFSGSSDMASLYSGKALPAYLNWKPIESYYFIYAP